MPDRSTFSSLAILYELSAREFKRKINLFPEDLRYYVILASSIIGSENSKRVKETPGAVTEESADFVSRLLEIRSPEQDEIFRGILETCLIEALKDELKYSCMNCKGFDRCCDTDALQLGTLFQRRVNGDESEELKREIALQVDRALQGAPHMETDEAYALCTDFVHQYSVSRVGEVFGRYADIAAALQRDFGIAYTKVQQQMIAINMQFCEKAQKPGPDRRAN